MTYPQQKLSPCNGIELSEYRQLTGKVYDLGDGQFKYYKTQDWIHYRDAAGNWEEIDLTPVAKKDHYLVDKTYYTLKIPYDKIGFSFTSVDGGYYEVESSSLIGSNPEIEDVGGHFKIWWRDVEEDLDIFLYVKPQGVEFYKILKSDRAPFKFEWTTKTTDSELLSTNKTGYGWDAENRKVLLSQTKEHNSIIEEFHGKVAVLSSRKLRRKNWVKEVIYPVTIDVPDVVVNITTGTDDAEESYLGYGYTVDATQPAASESEIANTLYVGQIGTATTTLYRHHSGIRFQNVAVNQGVTVTLADLVTTRVSIAGTPLTIIRGADVDDAPGWHAGTLPDINTIARTSASATPNTGAGTINQEVTGIVNEILARVGWVNNNNMSFLLRNQVPDSTTGNNRWAIEALENAGTGDAVLEITTGAAGEVGGGAAGIFGAASGNAGFIG